MYAEINHELTSTISIEQAWYYKIIPKKIHSNALQLLIDETQASNSILSELEIILGRKIELESISSEEIGRLLITFYPKGLHNIKESKAEIFKINVHADSFLLSLVKEAKSLNSSDIHIETYGEKCRIRFRVDGQLIDRHKISKAEYPTLVNKIKISAGCDIAEKRLPQDGRIRFQLSDTKLDIRVSILPALYGEKIVLRLLGNDASHIHIDKLGLNSTELERYKLAIQKPHGIILISGPTGSGKTTTLYATLKQLNKITSNILTIEDPIEYTLDGINQVQLKEDIGLTYSAALRTFLRQDPDVIMLGEIRDAETAQMAIRAALTGHLVLSTIHTNSAWGTVSRLTDMGIPGFLLGSTLNLSVAQRLIRLLCPHCKTEQELDKAILPSAFRNITMSKHYFPKGCEQCHFTGFKGRKAIYEVIPVSRELSEHIKSGTTNIDEYCKQHHLSKLSNNAFELFAAGATSLEETYPYLIHEN